MSTITLSQMTEWLASLDPETVVYFDSFEPRHCLSVAYLTAQGYTDVVSEYDKATSGKKTIATYTKDLISYLYELHHQSLRYVPTAQDLLNFAQNREDWSNVAHNGSFFTLESDAFNRLYESDLRPDSIAWKHIDIIGFHGREYQVRLQVLPASEDYTPDVKHSLPYTIIISSEENEDIAWLSLRHHHADGRIGGGITHQPYYSTGYQFSLSSLAENEYVDLRQADSGDVFATWQSRDGKLFLSPSIEEV